MSSSASSSMPAACADYYEQIHALVDGELSPSDRDLLRRHLEDCPPCLTEYERDQLLKSLVRRSCACEEAPSDLRARIMTRITSTTVQTEDGTVLEHTRVEVRREQR